MTTFILYFGLAMAATYVLVGLFLLIGPSLGIAGVYFAYQPIVAGLVLGYGVFRGIRTFKNFQNHG